MLSFFKSEKWRKFREGGSLLTVLTVIAVAIGVGLGFGIQAGSEEKWSPRQVVYLEFVGTLFLRVLSALILPLIVCSLVDAIGSLDLSLSKKIGTRALVYYLSTTAVAAIIGIILGITIQPGNRTDFQGGSECISSNTTTVDTLLDLVRNVFPNNLVGATMEVAQTKVDESNDTIPYNERKIEIVMVRGTNMLGLVVFSMVLGVTLGSMKSAGKPVLNFFKSLGDATMLITIKVVSFSPVAICFLIAAQLVDKDIAEVFKNIAWYFATVMCGLLIHGFIVLPLTYFLMTKMSPITFFVNMFQAIATAFGTASSSATLPLTMKCLEENNNIDVRVSRFVIPIGATVNMNGTALYLPVGAIFIAQLCGIQLGIGQLISISLISIATSIGAAGIPQVGMVIMITVLSSVGLPAEYITYILPIDWLLERFRTAVNVLGDAYGAGIVAHMSKPDLDKIPLDNTSSSEPSFSNDNDSRTLVRNSKLNDSLDYV